MNQLTIRGFDREVERRLRALADSEGLSLSQAAMRLIRRGAGLEPLPPGAARVGGALDHLIGSWTEADAAELEHAVADLETIDLELWR
ncbi:MAG: hypothetical protein ACI8PZ_001778 [Myxococcota bacterium]|jgi:hypothetical protein